MFVCVCVCVCVFLCACVRVCVRQAARSFSCQELQPGVSVLTVVSTRGRERVFLSLVLALSVCMRAERRACRWLLHTVDREGASCRCTYSRMLACERERDRAAPEACAEGLLTVTTGGAGPLAPAATHCQPGLCRLHSWAGWCLPCARREA